MQFNYSTDPRLKIPLINKIFLFLGIAVSLCLLFVFATTFVLIALVAGTVLYFVSWLQKPGKRPPLDSSNSHPDSQTHTYKKPPGRDDDVIDI